MLQLDDENDLMKTALEDLVKKSPKQFPNSLNNNSKFSILKTWIISKTSKKLGIDEARRTIVERVFWILKALTDFPKCANPNCKKLLNDPKSFRSFNLGYKRFCSCKCANSDKETREKTKASRKARNGGDYFSEASLEKKRKTFILKYGVDNNMKSEVGLKAYQDSLEKKYGVKNQWQREDIKQKMREKRKEKHGSATWNNPEKMVKTKLERHGTLDFSNKARETWMKNFGIDHPMKVQQIAEKSFENRTRKNSMYMLDGIRFDSLPEMCFYIYYRDHGIPLDCHPKSKILKYFDKFGKQHSYHPDFYLPHLGYIIELKGNNHFKDKDPTKPMISFKGREFDYIEEAKMKCMKNNGVVLVASNDYQFYLDYAKKTYGMLKLKEFRSLKKTQK